MALTEKQKRFQTYQGNNGFKKFMVKKLWALNKLSKHLFSYSEDKLTEDSLKVCLQMAYLLKQKNVHPIRIAAAVSALNFILPEWRDFAPPNIISKIVSREDKVVSAWKRFCLKRDGNKCTKCDSITNLSVHHIFPWSEYPELRLDVSNGETLCGECHHKEHFGMSASLFIKN